MIVTCPRCRLPFDDAARSTLCPHFELGTGPTSFCRRCDQYRPCAHEKAETMTGLNSQDPDRFNQMGPRATGAGLTLTEKNSIMGDLVSDYRSTSRDYVWMPETNELWFLHVAGKSRVLETRQGISVRTFDGDHIAFTGAKNAGKLPR